MGGKTRTERNANEIKGKGDQSEAYREGNLDLACRNGGLKESEKETKNPNPQRERERRRWPDREIERERGERERKESGTERT